MGAGGKASKPLSEEHSFRQRETLLASRSAAGESTRFALRVASPSFLPRSFARGRPHNISICNTNDGGGGVRRSSALLWLAGVVGESDSWTAKISYKSKLLTPCFWPISWRVFALPLCKMY